MFEIGLFHDNPVSAAKFLNKIWNDIDSWWNEPKLKKIKENFTNKYSKKSNNVSTDLLNLLQKVYKNI